jgi:APA family basic amino acid/polyamine antiporter
MGISIAHSENRDGLLHELGLRDAMAIVAGTVIGSGIFLVPHSVAVQLPSFRAVLLVWIIGGMLSLFGAIALGELGAAFPDAGGLYVYLGRAYGQFTGFLYGWALLTMIQSGSIATLAVAFRIYLGQVISLSSAQQKIAGIGCVLLLTAVNCLGIRNGQRVQNAFALGKFGGLALMVGILLLRGHGQFTGSSSISPNIHPAAWGVALIAVLWAYEGWHVVSFAAGEFKQPQRDLPLGLLYGTAIVCATYLLANLAYYSVLNTAQLQQSEHVAATAIRAAVSPASVPFMSLLILVSIVGAANGMILTGPRVYYAMAKQGTFLPVFAYLNSRSRAPVFAILVQGLWASCLTLLGTFQELFTYVVFTAWVFYGLAVAAVVVLRRREPDLPRPFLAPGYPWMPVLFVLAAIGITVSAIVSSPRHAAYGSGLVLTGVPVYFLILVRYRRRTSKGELNAS